MHCFLIDNIECGHDKDDEDDGYGNCYFFRITVD